MVDINTIMESVGNAAPVIAGSKLFTDFASPTVKEAGELGKRLFKGVFSGAYHWADRREKMFQELQNDVLVNLEGIDPNRIVNNAPTYIVAPAMMAWSYSMDNAILRDMYAKLLAHTAIADKQELLHPCFAEIIKQLHPSEAFLFNYIHARDQIELLLSRWHISNTNFIDSLKHIAFYPKEVEFKISANGVPGVNIFKQLVPSEELANPVHIENLSRLSLISVSYIESLTSYDQYEKLEGTENVKADKKKCEDSAKEFRVINGRAAITPLGKQFAEVCLIQPT